MQKPEPGPELLENRKRGEFEESGVEDAVTSADEEGEPLEHEEIQRAAARLDEPSQSSESDTEPDADAEPRGAGLSGSGPPMIVGRLHRAREICDGAGRCSPGKWPPRARPTPSSKIVSDIGTAIRRCVQRLDYDGRALDVLFSKLASGKVCENPFPAEETRGLLEFTKKLLGADAEPRRDDQRQLVRIRLIQALLREAGDPDWKGMDWFAKGIRIGVGVRLPRTPAVFSRKQKWRLPDQSDPEMWKKPSTDSVWRDNYKSAKGEEKEIERQLSDMTDRDLCLKLEPGLAAKQFPGLVVSSLGVVVKEATTPDSNRKVRIVLDGTHGVQLNRRIRVRDQDRCPTALDVKRQQREQQGCRRGLGLAADAKDAHRLPVVDPRDWRLQSCRARSGGDVYIFKVGVFGISSIAYWWARLGGACVRAVHYLADPLSELWLQLMADDLKIESTAGYPKRELLWTLLCLDLFGVPLSWAKMQGGASLEWIGYSVLVRELV